MANNDKGGQMVCVTGAGGFIGSWVVKELLLRGYVVRGTVRDPAAPKNAHLQTLDGARERLRLCYADVMDYKSLCAAFHGCDGVFHVASPLSKDPKLETANCQTTSEMTLCQNTDEPGDSKLVPVAVEGTKNVINAVADMGIRRLVFTSSYGAVHMDPNRSPDTVLDESCWSDLEFCKQEDWYCYAKTVAEIEATKLASKRGIQMPVVLPSFTIGQMLQPTLNASIRAVAIYLNGTKKSYRNIVVSYVDVRDVARAHVLVYEDPTAHGRYLCIGTVLHLYQFLQLLRELFPQYPITNKYADDKPLLRPYKFSNRRLRSLGLEFTPIRESLRRTVISLQENGHLPAIYPHSCM
ncbi:hypothetical protein ACP70R_045103 [Stipagrostis hirtigluma subsp. patula]